MPIGASSRSTTAVLRMRLFFTCFLFLQAGERRAQMMRMKSLISYQQAKLCRQKKIKSKRCARVCMFFPVRVCSFLVVCLCSYRRLLKRQKRKQLAKEFEELRARDPAAAREKL